MEIVTVTGRRTSGTLVEVNPRYIHDYGDFQPELLKSRITIKRTDGGGKLVKADKSYEAINARKNEIIKMQCRLITSSLSYPE